jgi:hypothetical protein
MEAYSDDGSHSGDEYALVGLFDESQVDDWSFRFDAIRLERADDVKLTTVVFEYSISTGAYFQSSMILQGPGDQLPFSALFAVGMCSALWFWMGFATPTIEISASLCGALDIDPSMLQFWDTFINGVLLEFRYVNKLKKRIVLVPLGGAGNNNSSSSNGPRMSCKAGVSRGRREGVSDGDVLIPMGGK